MKKTQNQAVGGLVDEPFRPRAWAIFVDNGNASMWSTLQPYVQNLADAEGLTITPLYDKAALEDAVATERERCARAVVNYSLSYPFDENDRSLFAECAQYVRDGALYDA